MVILNSVSHLQWRCELKIIEKRLTFNHQRTDYTPPAISIWFLKNFRRQSINHNIIGYSMNNSYKRFEYCFALEKMLNLA